jgi:hypothetical protein
MLNYQRVMVVLNQLITCGGTTLCELAALSFFVVLTFSEILKRQLGGQVSGNGGFWPSKCHFIQGTS